MYPLIVPLEILGQFMRLISLSVRLYANMLAGHMLILTFLGLIFIIGNRRPRDRRRARRCDLLHLRGRDRRLDPGLHLRRPVRHLHRLGDRAGALRRRPQPLSSLSHRRRRRRGRRRQGDRARARYRSRLARRRRRHRQHLRLDDPGRRPAARAPRRAAGHPVARLRPHRGGRLLRPDRRPARLRPRLSMVDLLAAESSNDLIKVVPGLMIWTLVAFAITFFVLRKYAFGPIQKTIDDRRDRIRQAVEEADNARERGARAARAEPGDPRAGALGVGGDPRRGAQGLGRADRRVPSEEAEAERQRRLEDTRKQIDAETARAIDQIRSEVADLTVEATAAGRRQGARRRGPAAADRRGDRGPRLLGAGAGRRADGRRAAHVRARPLRGRAGAGSCRRRARAARRSSRTRSTRPPSSRRSSPTRSSTRPPRRMCSTR